MQTMNLLQAYLRSVTILVSIAWEFSGSLTIIQDITIGIFKYQSKRPTFDKVWVNFFRPFNGNM